MKPHTLLLTAAIVLCANIFASETYRRSEAFQRVEGAELLRYNESSSVPTFIKFHSMFQMEYELWETWMMRTFYKDVTGVSFQLLRVQEDNLGMKHYRFRQFHRGIPVEVGTWIIHTKDNKVISMNGNLIDKVEVSAPVLSEAQALQVALDYVDARTYMWEVPAEEAFVKHVRQDSNATYYPTGSLEITAEYPSISMEELFTCWKFDIYAAEPESRRYVYVDAANGSIVSDHSRIQHTNDTVTAHTMYAGQQEIVADWDASSNQWRLRETGRGDGIETYNAQYQTTGSYVDFTFSSAPFDDTLSFDQYATDAHLGAEKSYDYFLDIHDRNSVDDNGQILLSRVHWGVDWVNASWNGEWMTYGDGDTAEGITPLTALDVCGHELAHGVTQHTAGLVYRWEPGALNESFSDIFGVAVEFYTMGYPNGGDWVLGEDFNWIIRSLEEPNLYDQPDTYMGNLWYPGPYDNAGVHVNSGVQNHWFYLLSEGGSGSNDLGNVFTVTGIGIDDAADIAYRNLSVYLTEYSIHYDARFYAIQSAIDLFGPCSQQAISTEMAWYAVGVGNLPSTGVESDYLAMPAENCQIPTDVWFINFTSNGTSFEWDFGDGTTSTEANPMHTYTDWGTYDVELTATSTCGSDVLTDVDAIILEPDADCWIAMNETNAQATGCSGTLYDPGGPIWGYDNGLDYSVTIKPLGAGGVKLFFNYVISEGQASFGSCYDYLTVYDGFDANAPIMGHFCDSLPAPDSLESTGSAMTVRFRSDGNNPPPSFWPGFWLEWECTPTTVAPTAEFSFENYYSCSGDIQFIDQSDGGPSSWLWNFGDGTTSTEQDPLHHYINDGTYTVKLSVSNAFGSDSITKSSTIVIGKNPAPVTIQDDICPGEVGTLVPQEEGEFRWYAGASDTAVLYEGDTFITPTIQNSTLYYYENLRSLGTQQAGGALNNLMGGGGYVNFFNQALWFHALQDFVLEEVTMYTDTAGNRKITLWDPINNVAVDSAVVFLELGENNVELNFHIPEGTYELGMWFTDLLRCFRNNSGVTYPYEIPEVLSIYNSPAGSSYYYYFYNWQVRPYCASARGEAIASVAICTGVDELDMSDGLDVYPNPTRGELNLSQSVVPLLENIALYDAQGRMVFKLPSMRKDEPTSIDVSNLSAGIYVIKAYTENAVATKQVVIQ